MFPRREEWNISFAGCGFRSVYYLGAAACILERAPRLVYGASKICGASSGCLVAAALTVGLPIEDLFADLLAAAKEARKHCLSVFHPTFSLLRTLRDSLREKLPEDAHRRASGRLCVSLTRMSDGSNVLVSHFDSREELIQVLMCSCFFPVYCGFFPPSYRGQFYIDGALSNNMPLLELPNTITVAPFCSESDISPKDGAWATISVHCCNLSIQVTAGNVRRIYTSFLPPAPEELAEIFHSGYKDALHFLRQEELLGRSSDEVEVSMAAFGGQHLGLEHKHPQSLPLKVKKSLCVACRNAGDIPRSQSSSPFEGFYSMLTPLVLTLELILFLLKSLLKMTNKQQRQSGCHDNNSSVSAKKKHSRLDLYSEKRY
ncbi:patatin-like phospholipase domain-containing protein 2 isoform X2 [Syngnathoides biaculeatus]|uniref:patatin-like phospholipase domain-containing protein 2 isoform X2 n=1 Tax=Syngnathoides biaculeatus TaxID=300417 RepID=UPI002ADDCD38|nr:patatin-like phospholipase domain-containing protein 2 isoform X2 [Syngnathoides biaculeatus]